MTRANKNRGQLRSSRPHWVLSSEFAGPPQGDVNETCKEDMHNCAATGKANPEREIQRVREREREKKRERKREGDTEREREKEREREREIEREREREGQRVREKE